MRHIQTPPPLPESSAALQRLARVQGGYREILGDTVNELDEVKVVEKEKEGK